MAKQRVDRLNSLLKEVLAEVIRKDVHNPKIHEFTSVSRVDIKKDLRHAKVYVSILASDLERTTTVKALQSAAGFIGSVASKKVVMRFFPSLTFILDETVDKQMRIEALLGKIRETNGNKVQTNEEGVNP